MKFRNDGLGGSWGFRGSSVLGMADSGFKGQL